jgi:hypothetical protein
VNRRSSLIIVLCGVTAMAMAQTTPDAQNGTPAPSATMQSGSAMPQTDTPSGAQNNPSTAIPATLAKSVDSKKVKAGDEIDAKLSVSLTNASGTQIPAGSKIVGHVADAKSKAKGDPQSSLTFAFEKIVLKNGQDMPLHAVPQAIGMPQMMADAAVASDNSRPTSAGSPSGGMRGNTNANPGSGTAAAGGSAAPSDPMSGGTPAGGSQATNGPLPQNATGAVGMKGLTLDSQSSGAIIASDSKSVKLEEGTQLLLRVLPQ